jgi:hypothetical protein
MRLATLITVPFLLLAPGAATAQSRTAHVMIPNLAKPSELDFEGADCDRTDDMMTCRFQQVLLMPMKSAPDTCEIVTNRYESTFARQGPKRWVSNEGPDGICGVVAITTLEQDGNDGSLLWTMNTQKIVTNKGANDLCKTLDERPETLTWRESRRPLPCKFVVPAAIH